MFAILTEHFAGKWPFWLSPKQVMLVPISEANKDYCFELKKSLRKSGFYVEVDASDRKMQKKVREAQLEQYNYILVCGDSEQANGTVNVRTRDNKVHGEHKLEALIEVLTAATREASSAASKIRRTSRATRRKHSTNIHPRSVHALKILNLNRIFYFS